MHKAPSLLIAVQPTLPPHAHPAALRSLVAIFFLLACTFALWPRVALAGDITVNNTTCLLPEAIVVANTDTNGANCTISPSPTPGGADNLLLAAGNHTLLLGLDVGDGLNGAASITSTMTIVGNPAGSSIVRGGITTYRLLHVSATGNLTLQDVTLSNGNEVLFGGGALYNRGTLNLIDATLSSNTTIFQGGALYNNGGTLNITDSFIISNTSTGTGGGIFNDTGPLTISGSTIRFNNSLLDGGGLTNSNNGTANITATTFQTNTAGGVGGAIYNSSATINLNDSFLLFNTAFTCGGLYNTSGTANVDNTDFIGNEGTESVGGLYNTLGTANVTDSTFERNEAFGLGGGLYTLNGTINVTDTLVLSNTSTSDGGGFYSNNGTINVRGSTVRGNSANRGGGFYVNLSPATLNLFDTDVLSNTASGNGGGIYTVMSAVNLTDSSVAANVAQTGSGGGIYNDNGPVTLTNSDILANRAAFDGGGIYNGSLLSTLQVSGGSIASNVANSGTGGGVYNSAVVTMTNTSILSNTASSTGGGVHKASGTVYISGSRLLGNVSLSTGSAFYQPNGLTPTTIDESCIVNNSDTAVYSDGDTPLDATDNWWGAPDGPAGQGPGSGDSVSFDVDFNNFKTSPILGCPLRTADISLTKIATTVGAAPLNALLPGQPLTFTVTLSNTGQRVSHLVLNDPMPAGFQVTQVITSGAPMTQSGDNYYYVELATGMTSTITFIGLVNVNLNATTPLNNVANLADGAGNEWVASASATAVPPAVSFSAATYTANETQGTVTITLLLSPINPYAQGSVNLVSTDSAANAAVNAVQAVTFPPGSSSQSVPVAIADDEVVLTRTIDLALQSLLGLQLGTPSSAQIIINEDEQAGLLVQKEASIAEAAEGDTITYSYLITNTGNVTLTISANDDRLGNVPGLAGTLAPQASRSATIPYVVQADDPQGELTNTVTVTGTFEVARSIVVSDDATVVIGDPTSLPEEEQPDQQTHLFLPKVDQ